MARRLVSKTGEMGVRVPPSLLVRKDRRHRPTGESPEGGNRLADSQLNSGTRCGRVPTCRDIPAR